MAQKYIDQYDMDVQLDKKISQISVGEAQRVEIIKILARGAEIIILDEPTAVLTPQETEKLFNVLRNMKADGKSIIMISEEIPELLGMSDRIFIMKDGKINGEFLRSKELDENDLIAKMV